MSAQRTSRGIGIEGIGRGVDPGLEEHEASGAFISNRPTLVDGICEVGNCVWRAKPIQMRMSVVRWCDYQWVKVRIDWYGPNSFNSPFLCILRYLIPCE